MSYKINKDYILAENEGSPYKAQNYFVVVHETANPKATGVNEAVYMKRNWRNVYAHYVVGCDGKGNGGQVYLIGSPGYISYTVANANSHAPIQIELQHSLNPKIFLENYKVYIELIRDSCDKYNIPKTLDTAGKYTKGVKTHYWCTYNWGGTDHVDPYPYLKLMGISKEQFAKDIASGIDNKLEDNSGKGEIDLMDRGNINYIAYSDSTDMNTLQRVIEYFIVSGSNFDVSKTGKFKYDNIDTLIVVDKDLAKHSGIPKKYILVRNMKEANDFYASSKNWDKMAYSYKPKE